MMSNVSNKVNDDQFSRVSIEKQIIRGNTKTD